MVNQISEILIPHLIDHFVAIGLYEGKWHDVLSQSINYIASRTACSSCVEVLLKATFLYGNLPNRLISS
jgi:hypothetical protein